MIETPYLLELNFKKTLGKNYFARESSIHPSRGGVALSERKKQSDSGVYNLRTSKLDNGVGDYVEDQE